MYKIVISYFYQVRNMPPYMIPISTRFGDPKWYHDFTYDKEYVFKDKRGVWNGIRADVLHMPFGYEAQCGPRCTASPDDCSFLNDYYEYLKSLDFEDICERCYRIGDEVRELENLKEEPVIALMVHEAPKNSCSERSALIKWFADNGYELKEFKKEDYI